MIAGTLQTDPRSGGIKRSSGVNVLPIVAETWAKVRDNSNADVDWLICGYVANSKTDITVIQSGSGGPNAAAAALPEGEPCWGGCKMSTGRFMGFYYVSSQTLPKMSQCNYPLFSPCHLHLTLLGAGHCLCNEKRKSFHA